MSEVGQAPPSPPEDGSPAPPAVVPARRTMTIGGRPTLVETSGEGSPVLYLHGLAGDVHAGPWCDRWPPMLEELAAAHRVVAPALPGYPGTDGAEIDGVEDHVFFCLDLLDALDLERAAVVGHSLGGWVAAELALRHRERVERLILIDALGLHVAGCAPAPFFGAVAPRGLGGYGEVRRLLFSDPDGASARLALPDDATPEHELRWFSGLAGAARIGWPAPHFQSRALARRLSRISCPTLLVWGADDRLAPAAHAAAWQAGIPGARLVVIPGGGHCLPMERPSHAAGATLELLAEAGAASHG